MARRGPKRKLGGKKRAQSYTVAGTIADIPEPKDLGTEALEEWHRIVTKLSNAGRLDHVEYASIEHAAWCFGEIRSLRRKIAEEGATYPAGDLIKKNPAVDVLNAVCNQRMACIEKLGLSAHAMHRFGDVEQQDATDELAEFGKEKPVLRAVNE